MIKLQSLKESEKSPLEIFTTKEPISFPLCLLCKYIFLCLYTFYPSLSYPLFFIIVTQRLACEPAHLREFGEHFWRRSRYPPCEPSHRLRNALSNSPLLPGEERCMTTLKTAAKESFLWPTNRLSIWTLIGCLCSWLTVCSYPTLGIYSW